MAPPLIFLGFVIIVAAVAAIGMLVAIRTGLWVRQTSTDAEVEVHDPERAASMGPSDDEQRFERPEHVEVSDPAKQRFIGT